jgi:protein TonB
MSRLAAARNVGVVRWVVVGVLAVAINAGFVVLMEGMVSRDTVRSVTTRDVQPVEFLRTEIEQETRSKDRRRKPPPKPQEVKTQTTRIEQMQSTVADLPMPDTAFDVSSILDTGGVGGGVALGGQRLVAGERAQASLTQVGVNDLVPMVVLPPQYPPRALMRGIEGHVTVSFVVDGRGLVQDVDVVDAEPEGYFEEAARAAVQRWRFRPHRRDGEPIPVVVTTRIVFDRRLEQEQQERRG